MKKMLYVILALVFLVIGFVVFKTVALMSIDETKSVEIKALQKDVFTTVSCQSNYHKWSPYLYNDDMLKYDLRNEDGAVGNQLHWSGGKKGEDLGYQEVDSIDTPCLVILKCYIEKPFPAKSTFEYTFTQMGDNTLVQQRFIMNSSFISAFFMFAFGAEKIIDNSNNLALDLLKKECEKN